MASGNGGRGPRTTGRAEGAVEGADAGELERIREILVGGVSRSADERFAALEHRLEAALAELSARVDREVAALRREDERKVGRGQLAALLSDTSRRLVDDGTGDGTGDVMDEAA